LTEEELNNKIKKFAVQLIESTKSNLLSQPGVFELFGLDFMLDKDLNLWFVEAKTTPNLKWPGGNIAQFYQPMLKDIIDIEMSLRTSRLERTRKIIAEIHKTQANVKAVDYEDLKDQFAKDILDQISPSAKKTSFQLIYDSNNKDIFEGILPSSCHHNE
jgi:hypothetical protein